MPALLVVGVTAWATAPSGVPAMASRKRERIPPTAAWRQLELLGEGPGQRSYEVIRPVVLFGEPVPTRATTTQAHARTIYRSASLFTRAPA